MQQHSVSQTQYSRAPLWLATFALLFDRKRYLELALRHFLAINLEAPDLAAKHRAGLFPPAGWEVSATADARKGMEQIRSALFSAFAKLAGITAATVVLLWFGGQISSELPWAWSKVFSLAGGFLAGWATVFELGGIWRSWEGEALHELAHPKIFIVLFLPGCFLAAVGQLW